MFVAGWRHDLRSEWPFIIILLLLRGNIAPIKEIHIFSVRGVDIIKYRAQGYGSSRIRGIREGSKTH